MSFAVCMRLMRTRDSMKSVGWHTSGDNWTARVHASSAASKSNWFIASIASVNASVSSFDGPGFFPKANDVSEIPNPVIIGRMENTWRVGNELEHSEYGASTRAWRQQRLLQLVMHRWYLNLTICLFERHFLVYSDYHGSDASWVQRRDWKTGQGTIPCPNHIMKLWKWTSRLTNFLNRNVRILSTSIWNVFQMAIGHTTLLTVSRP